MNFKTGKDGKESLKIAMVTYLFPPTFAGGARHAIELAKGLRARGVESFFIGANLNGAPPFEIFEGFSVFRAKPNGKKRIGFLTYVLKVCRRLFSERHSFQIVHLHSVRPFYFLIVALARILKKPVILCPTLTGHDDPIGLRRKSFLLKIESRMYFSYEKIICKSTALKKACMKAGLPDSSIAVIPGAIPCGGPDSFFRPAGDIDEVRRTRRGLGLPEDSFIVAFAGRIQSRKGCGLLFEAWEKILGNPRFRCHLLLIGPYDQISDEHDGAADPAYISKLKSCLEQKDQKRLIFTGNVAHAEVARYLRASDCFVFPSTREGMGKVVVEAMASGLPVICTLIPDVTTDMIENGRDGIIIETRRPSDLADAIAKLMEDKELRKRLSFNAVEKACKKFSISRVVDEHLQLYKSLLKRD